jgi:hypothetical protein
MWFRLSTIYRSSCRARPLGESAGGAPVKAAPGQTRRGQGGSRILPCPLRSESDAIAAQQRNVARGYQHYLNDRTVFPRIADACSDTLFRRQSHRSVLPLLGDTVTFTPADSGSTCWSDWNGGPRHHESAIKVSTATIPTRRSPKV